ncbi:hypothetical protein CJF42_03495 [Pseudoalteromonas sp. NBT06-2]|uniref:carbohydrate binding family 9 domain-containing protein n=1 Tax=Pseudoalteromonas sp. NBT06-2 TaxID=2025950 RepID=UPI000BA707C8|nr:carbohydrate binding family 9 domain-containing protein [Pseudoalteromonas sp. NBT06-2]PAJ75708.1 hypothetical protein CJF42_03495 [Pseudoalteromonas sp. NBT06-2]
MKTNENIKIDGVLSEKEWANAPSVSDFKIVKPYLGRFPSENTEINILYSEEFIFFSGLIKEKKSDIVANIMSQGKEITEDDYIFILLDTFNDKRNGYWFAINPNGVRNEGLVENNSRIIPEWDGRWEAATQINEDSWSFEMKIPLNIMSSKKGELVDWGFNVTRYRAKKREESRWQSISQNEERYSPASIGTLFGLNFYKSAKKWEARSAISVSSIDTSTSDAKYEFKPSLDFIYNIDSSNKAIVTLNTDFSAVEVDNRVVNDEQYSTFFPEKRDFFLEDAGVFEFGGLNGNIGILTANGMPFHSRKIGLDSTGRPEDIDVGVKISGRNDNFSYGLLGVRVDHEDRPGAKNLMVGRLSYQIDDTHQIGTIATYGDPTTDDSNNVIGIDYIYRSNNLFGNNIINVNTWFQHSNSAASPSSDKDIAYGFMVELPNDKFYTRLGLSEVQDNFNPGLGFIARTGIRQYTTDFAYKWRFKDQFIESFSSSLYSTHFTSVDNKFVSSETYLNLVEVDNHAGDSIQLSFSNHRDRLAQGFPLFNKLFVEEGYYSDTRYWLTVATAKHRKFSSVISYVTGERYGGDYERFSLSVDVLKLLKTNVSVYYSNLSMTVNDKNEEVNLARIKSTTSFAYNLSLSNTIQYDDLSKSLGINSRFHWELNPGNSFYVVLNYGANYEEDQFDYSNKSITAKYSTYF